MVLMAMMRMMKTQKTPCFEYKKKGTLIEGELGK